jgi:hypothetical protein
MLTRWSFGTATAGGCLIAFSLATTDVAQAHPGDPCDGLVQWPLYVTGLPAEPLAEFLRADPDRARAFVRGGERAVTVPLDAEGLPTEPLPQAQQQVPVTERVIDGLGIQLDETELVALLQRLHEEPLGVYGDVPVQLQGIAGLTTVLFLQKVYPPDAEEPIANKVISGRIRDYIFVEATGRGHLAVDTCIDVLDFVPVGEDRREFLHWDIDIAPGGFSAGVRKEPDDPDSLADYAAPFPGISLALPAFTVDPTDPRSVSRRGLDHKLHARGETAIDVTDIHYRRLADPELERFDDSHPWYESTPASCVDLFTEGPPPGTFGELVSADYCLGRCEQPMIVNSGD